MRSARLKSLPLKLDPTISAPRRLVPTSVALTKDAPVKVAPDAPPVEAH